MKKTKTDKRSDRIPKNTKTVLTIEHILTLDSVKEVLEKLINEQVVITDMICIFRARDGTLNWRVTQNSSIDALITMIEQAKLCILTGDDE